jgi:hypothetical protein
MHAHTHDPGEPGLIVETHLREHMAEVHGHMVAGPYETLRTRHDGEHPELFDPEMLEPVEKIRYAEQLIRHDHPVLGDDYLFWGRVADHLNQAANIPGRTGDKRPSKWPEFNRAQDMATGYIRMSARAAKS